MRQFTVILMNCDDRRDTITETVPAQGAVQACSIAQKMHPGYIGLSSDVKED